MAVCRFFDANTGYAGGLHVSGHPVFGTRGLFKSQIVFQLPQSQAKHGSITRSNIEQKEITTDAVVRVYPVPANDVVNIALPDAFINTASTISILSIDGKMIETIRSAASNLIQVNVSKLKPGVYVIRIATNGHTINKTFTVVR